MASHSQQRHLKELLKEDQEPFLLTSYIADKQCQLKKQSSLRQQQVSSHRTHHNHNLQLKKKPKQNASFPSHFCKSACFFSSFHADSPDYFRKSPLLSPVAGNKSPSRALFLHVPAKTAALLLEAATRIQKNSSSSTSNLKSKTQIKSSGFGLLGSVIKRLTNGSRTRKLETGDPKARDDVVRWADSVKTSSSGRRSSATRRDELRIGFEVGLVGKSNLVMEDQVGISNGRLSSVWSEENKSMASSSSSSSSSSRSASASTSGSGNLSEEEGEEEVGFVNSLEKENGSNEDEEFTFCLSPLSPFRFALYQSPSPDRQSPAFSSPANSPSRRKFQDHINYEQDPSVKFQVEDEEEKEQNSPVSILDPPFGDDECEEEEGEECNGEEDGFDVECSYAFVQRAKQQLLQKLRKFEKLAELDPIELEKRMVEEQDEDDYEELECEAENDSDDLSNSLEVKENIDGYLDDIARRSGAVQDLLKPGMKGLLSDLISEEEKACCSSSGNNYESIVKRVCNRLESWKEVEPNTIDMMVGMDLRGETDDWKKPGEEISQTAKLVEFSIFVVLVEELLDELITSSA